MKQGKKNLKPLPKTMREKKRYILFRMDSEIPLNAKSVFFSIWEYFLEKFGVFWVAKSRFALIDFDEKNGLGIVKCSHRFLAETKKAISEVKKAGKVSVKAEVILVSGTIKKIKGKKKGFFHEKKGN